jgi:hypothetical protein
VPLLDLATRQDEIGGTLGNVLTVEFRPMGLEVPQFILENVSVPPEVEAALDKRSQMGILGNLDQYTKFQAANALEDAANNHGGAGEGVGLGMGVALGQQMGQILNRPTPAAPPPAPAGPPPLPTAGQWYLGVNGQQTGPFDPAALAAEVVAGRLTAATPAWKAGMGAWTPAGQIPELATLLPPTPPPLS